MSPVICVPVLKCYGLLREMIASIDVRPALVYVVDNGKNEAEMTAVTQQLATEHLGYWIHTPAEPLSVAASWNWFIANTVGERLITNDDIVFAKGSIRKMFEPVNDFVSCGFGFSCFVLRDACVEKVGKFDEEISPGYAYFEDRDYLARMKAAGVVDEVVQCGVVHKHSQTHAALTPDELNAHYKKYFLAQENFLRKHGKLPSDVERQFA